MNFIVGIDLAKQSFVAVILDKQGQKIKSTTTFKNSKTGFRKLCKWLTEPLQTAIVFESTGIYGKQLIKELSMIVGSLHEVNPALIKRMKSSTVQTKTDPADAMDIAKVGLLLMNSQPDTLGKYRVEYDSALEDLKLWVSEYRRISKDVAILMQRIENVSHHAALKTTVIVKRRKQELKRLKEQRKLTKKEIVTLLKELNSDEVHYLLSIPGIGPLTTAVALVTIRDINRFDSADALKAYLGAYPRRWQSGKHEGRSRMATNGSKLMKHMLWNAAKSAARHNPVCKELFERLVAKGKCEPAAYGAVARKLVQIIYGVMKNKTMFHYEPKTT